MSERQIDKAIDDAVRDLMNVDAEPAFRVRVVSRLERPNRTFSRLRVGAALVTMAAMVLLGVLLRPSPSPAPAPQTAANVNVPAPAVTQLPAGSAPAVEPARGAARGARRQRPAAPPRLTAIPRGRLVATVADLPHDTAMAGSEAAVDPIGSIAAIAIAPLAPAPITSSEIVVAPLGPIAEMQVAPLDPRMPRN